jgi:hypothetical protein
MDFDQTEALSFPKKALANMKNSQALFHQANAYYCIIIKFI